MNIFLIIAIIITIAYYLYMIFSENTEKKKELLFTACATVGGATIYWLKATGQFSWFCIPALILAVIPALVVEARAY